MEFEPFKTIIYFMNFIQSITTIYLFACYSLITVGAILLTMSIYNLFNDK